MTFRSQPTRSGNNRLLGAHFPPHGGIFEAAVC
jgi:hypothetical protein